MQAPNPDDVTQAAARLRPHAIRTPLLRHPVLDEATGGTILLKAESLQRTGSFKFRGATNAVLQLADPARGVVCHSSGNHGQAIAAAAAAAGIGATVFMPAGAPEVKVAATERWGATIRRYDRNTDDREAMSAAHAAATGATLIPPFEHPHVIAGQGTAALEAIEDARALGLEPDAMLVCTGGGGFMAGCALARDAAAPAMEMWTVEPAGWDDTARSLAAGSRVKAARGSQLCDALLAPTPGALTFSVNHGRVAGGVAVEDADVLAAMRFAFLFLKIVVEPGGAAALAALLSGRFSARGKTVIATLSGGNVDPAVFARALASS